MSRTCGTVSIILCYTRVVTGGMCWVVASPGRVLYTSSFPFVSAGGAQFTAASPLLPYSEGEFPGSSTLFSHCKNSNGRTA